MKIKGEIRCDDCGGWDIEWMHKCSKHGADFCRGCDCPGCDEEFDDDDEELSFEIDQREKRKNGELI